MRQNGIDVGRSSILNQGALQIKLVILLETFCIWLNTKLLAIWSSQPWPSLWRLLCTSPHLARILDLQLFSYFDRFETSIFFKFSFAMRSNFSYWSLWVSSAVVAISGVASAHPKDPAPLKFEHPGDLFSKVSGTKTCVSGILTNGSSNGEIKSINGSMRILSWKSTIT